MTWSRLRLCFGSIAAGSFISVPTFHREQAVPKQKYDFDDAIINTENKIIHAMIASNIPGACCVVNVDGQTVMKTGFGVSDVENLVPFTSKTSMRIASISKLITALITLRLTERGMLDLDEPLGGFLSSHEISLSHEGSKVENVTVRHLLNHTAGIRHYHTNNGDSSSDSSCDEFYSSTKYPTVSDAMQIFINDELESEPGSKFNYTTFGYSLLSFILEKSSGQTFEKLISEFKADLGLPNIFLDKADKIIPNRCRYYSNSENGPLKNTPPVDMSCKWAGGGLVSNAEDITQLGDILLYLLQNREDSEDRYLSVESIGNMTAYNAVTEECKNDKSGSGYFYGLGLGNQPEVIKHGKLRQLYRVGHTGGAVGASSVLMVVPLSCPSDDVSEMDSSVSGITVVLFCNHENGRDIIRLAAQIGSEFAEEIEQQS